MTEHNEFEGHSFLDLAEYTFKETASTAGGHQRYWLLREAAFCSGLKTRFITFCSQIVQLLTCVTWFILYFIVILVSKGSHTRKCHFVGLWRSCFFAGLFSYICPIGCTNFETSHIEKFRFPPSADRWNIIIIRNMISRPESVESHQGIVLFLYPILCQELVSFDFVH